MGLTASRLHQLSLIDEVVSEPLGGAHRDPESMSEILQSAIEKNLALIDSVDLDELVRTRQARLMQYGNFAAG